MLLLASEILNLPVAATATASRVGAIKELLVDPQDGRLLGFVISVGLFAPPRVLAVSDLLAIDRQAAVVKDPEDLVDPKEIVRLQKVLEEKIKVLDARVETESGKKLGRVFDLLLEPQLGLVSRYYVRGLTGERVIPAERVLKITPNGVVVQDELEVEAVAEVPA